MKFKTPLYDRHVALGAKLVDFAGFCMPLNYDSQIQEHLAVRKSSGLFDVSHMVVTDIKGGEVKKFLRVLLANDVAELKPGGALYSCMLREDGGIIDDLIVYRVGDDFFRIVSNAATRDKDCAWMKKIAADFDVCPHTRDEFAMIALQGKNARMTAAGLICNDILAVPRFGSHWTDKLFIARTGYTGEDGFEFIGLPDDIVSLWDGLINKGVRPCGLGARDSLRLEAGMMLYGQDMTEDNNPYESGLGWTVSLTDDSRKFIGRTAVEKIKKNRIKRKMRGITLDSPGVMRGGQKIYCNGAEKGVVTSGGFSPLMHKSIAFARLDGNAGNSCKVAIRGKKLPVSVGAMAFIDISDK